MVTTLANYIKSRKNENLLMKEKEDLLKLLKEYKDELHFWRTDLHSMYCNYPRENLRKIKMYNRKIESINNKIENINEILERKKENTKE